MKKEKEENTNYIDANQIKEVEMTDTHQLRCKFRDKDVNDKMLWNGEIQKIYLDNDGEAYAYDVYVY